MMEKSLWVGLGGAFGAIARHGLILWTERVFPGILPNGTLAVNVIGCALAGVLFQLANQNQILSEPIKLLIGVGVLGGFTTFSTFATETMQLVETKIVLLAVLNVAANVFASIGACYLGAMMTRWLTG